MNRLTKKLSRVNWVLVLYLQGIIILLIWLFLTGCTTVTYPTSEGQVMYLSFLTDRKFGGMRITLKNGTEVELQDYTSEQSKVAEAVARGVAAGLKP